MTLNHRQRRAFLAIILIHFDLGLLLGVDVFVIPLFFMFPLVVLFVLYSFSILLFAFGVILDYSIWKKGLETILKKKEVN